MSRPSALWVMLIGLLVAGSAHAAGAKLERWQREMLADVDKLDQQVDELQDRGRYQEALPKAELALKARVGVLGNSDPDATHDMLTLGSLYYLTGRYDDADPLFKQALAVREKAYGRDDPQVAQVLGDLGHLYATGEKYPEARAYYERALAILEKNPGPQAKSSIFALVNLASLDRDTGEYEQAGGALWPGPFARRAAIGRRRASPGVGARRCCLLLRGYRGLRARRVAAAARARNS